MAKKNGHGENKSPQTINSTPYRMPHNVDAERAVLGSMLLDNEIIPEVMEFVKASEFYAPAHQEIFEAVVEIHDRGQPVDLTLLADELTKRGKLEEAGGYITLAGLEQFVLSTGAAPELAKTVADKATLRKLMAAADTILRDCAEEKREVEKQVDLAEKLVYDVSQQTHSSSFVQIGDLMGDAIVEIGNLRSSRDEVTGLKTHFRDLDKLLNGLHPNDLIILAARPSIGKTAFVMNIVLNIAHVDNVPVGVFSLEMGREQINMRLLCSHSQIASHKVQRGMINENDFDTLRAKATELQDCPIFVDDTPGLTLMAVRARARRLKAQQPNLGLIVIDYLQLMSGSDSGKREQNRQQEVSEISRGLKGLARELNLPVIALSQLSRNIEQRSGKDKGARPMLSDLRESGAIEQDADVVMFVHRERKELEKNEDGSHADKTLPIDAEIIVGKHRNGPIGTAEMLFWADFTMFTDKAR